MSPLSLKAHGASQRRIALAKGWGGCAFFTLALFLSLRAGVPVGEALMRAVPAGVVGLLLAWAAAIAVTRHLLLAQIEHHRQRLLRERAAAQPRP